MVSFPMRETQTKITMSYHHTPIRMTKTTVIIPNAGEDTQKLDHSYIAGGNVKWHRHSGKQFGSSFKIKKLDLPYNSAVTLLDIYPREMKIYFHVEMCMQMFRAVYWLKVGN